MTVNWTAPASINTTGSRAHGIFAYSLNGATTVTSSGSINTTGSDAVGIYAASGYGRATTVTSSGSISTTGSSAYGIDASAINGASTVTFSGGINTTGGGAHGIYAASSNGATTVTSSGSINTTGIGAYGIYAHGFNGATTVTSSGSISTTGSYFAHGIYAYSSNGATTVTSSGSINTTGSDAYGIFASGINGATTVTSSGSISTTGDHARGIVASGTTVTVTSNGGISTTGAYAHGIDAYSSAGGTTVTSSGSISTTGSSAHAIYALSNGANSIAITGGSVSASGTGAAIFAASVYGTSLTNAGTITGNVLLQNYTPGISAVNSFVNSGVFNSGATVSLGSNGMLTNSGTMTIAGGTGALATTTLTGNYVQTGTGMLAVRADWTGSNGAGAADRLAITGTAHLAGTLIVSPINFPTSTNYLSRTFTILTAAGGILSNTMTVTDSAAVDYTLLQPDSNTLDLRADINFTGFNVPGLTANQIAVGQNLNAIYAAGTTLGLMPALLALPTGGQLGNALGQLSPLGDGASFGAVMATGNTFAQQLLSCRIAGEESETVRYIREGQCVWGRISARRFNGDGRVDGVGFRETGTLMSAGAQMSLGGNWHLGGGIGHEATALSTNSNAASQAERVHAGAVLKYNPGALMLAAAITGAHGWHDNTRQVAFTGFNGLATSSTKSSLVTGRLTAAYLLAYGSFYARPQIELAATRLSRAGYTEHGTGGIALRVADAESTVLSASPSLELGAEQRHAGGGVTRAFLKGGVTWRDTDSFLTTATFADAPPGTVPFAVSTRIDKLVADIGAGIDLIGSAGTALRLQYDGQLGESTSLHNGSAKLSVQF